MIRIIIKAALIAAVSTFTVGHAGAASQDYFLKLDGSEYAQLDTDQS